MTIKRAIMHTINYIILAHNCPQQLGHLLRRLSGINVYFYVHIDLKSDIEEFTPHLNIENLTLIKDRVACQWGDYSIVKATIKCIENVVCEKKHGHTILLSGSDYPIQSNQNIRAFFERNRDDNFIECKPIREAWPNHYKYRVQAYKYDFSTTKADFVCIPTIYSLRPKGILRNFFKLIKRALIDKKLCHLKKIKYFFLYKAPPKNTVFYGGSQWWALSNETLEKLFLHISSNANFTDFFKDAVIPDEVFFQTALKKLQEKYSDIKIKDSITYTKWKSKTDDSPETFKSHNYIELTKASVKYLFARKFDKALDESIFLLLDNHTKAS